MVGAYFTSGDPVAIRRVRDLTGHVTVSGMAGLKALNELAIAGDVRGIDYDPACYIDLKAEVGQLFATDWVAEQVKLGRGAPLGGARPGAYECPMLIMESVGA